MAGTKKDVMVLLKLDEVYKPGTDARKFAYSDGLAAVVEQGTFFDVYSLDSDERFWVNEVATYFELLSTLWADGIVDRDLAEDWASPAASYWKLIGPILVQAREVFESDQIWTGFEALVLAQMQD